MPPSVKFPYSTALNCQALDIAMVWHVAPRCTVDTTSSDGIGSWSQALNNVNLPLETGSTILHIQGRPSSANFKNLYRFEGDQVVRWCLQFATPFIVRLSKPMETSSSGQCYIKATAGRRIHRFSLYNKEKELSGYYMGFHESTAKCTSWCTCGTHTDSLDSL